MEYRMVKKLANQLDNGEATRRFIEVIELRQRLFREHRETILILDAYDLVCDHVLLYSGQDSRLIGYLRSVSLETCRQYDIAFPMEALIASRPEYGFAYKRFLNLSKNPMHMGYLCFDPAYKSELNGLKAIDLLAWLGFISSGVPVNELGLACTLNNRYKQDVPMRLVGEWIPNLPDFKHPVVDDPHRVVLIPRLAEDYWPMQVAKFSAALQTLTDGERDLLRDSGIAA